MNTAASKPRRASVAIRRAFRTLRALTWASLLATTAHAQQTPADAQASGTTKATAADELGRLFFTPERRRQLDRQREFRTEERPLPPADPTLTIDGVVTRSSGKRTVWINGTALNDSGQADNVAVGTNRRTPGEVVVRPASGLPTIPAKVGDTVNSATGEANGMLDGGSITMRSKTPR